jgi:hypothetical protein
MWSCQYGTAAGTCSLSSTAGFNQQTAYTVNLLGVANVVLDLYTINYSVCYTPLAPTLDNPQVNGVTSGLEIPWGSNFNFTVYVSEPQGRNC